MGLKNKVFFIGAFLILLNVSSLMAISDEDFIIELRALVSTDNGL